MGIGNDIRQKRTYHHHEHSHVQHFEDTEESKPEDLSHGEVVELENDFFDYAPKEGEVKPKPHAHPARFSKWIIILFVLALIGITIYQNLDQVMIKLGLREEVKTDQNDEKVETYSSTNTNATSSSTTNSTATTTTPSTTVPAAAPSSTQSSSASAVDKSAITLKVLNGNGISGSAQAISDALKAQGFNPEKVSNAKSFSYNQTYIYYQTGKEAEANLIAAVLADRNLVKEASDTIAGSYNILVVVGKK